MMNEIITQSGGCMCGAVRYDAMGEPFWVGHCHCRSCRKHTGAPVVTFAGYKKEKVEFTKGERKIFESSPGVKRAFCGDCGTPLTWEGSNISSDRGEIVELYISTFDDEEALVPTNHLWYPERISWFDTADDLPRFVGFDFSSDICQHGPARKGLP